MESTPSSAAASWNTTSVVWALMRYSPSARAISLSWRCHFTNSRGWWRCIAPWCWMTVLWAMVWRSTFALSLVLIHGRRWRSLIIVIRSWCRWTTIRRRIPLRAATATSTLPNQIQLCSFPLYLSLFLPFSLLIYIHSSPLFPPIWYSPYIFSNSIPSWFFCTPLFTIHYSANRLIKIIQPCTVTVTTPIPVGSPKYRFTLPKLEKHLNYFIFHISNINNSASLFFYLLY